MSRKIFELEPDNRYQGLTFVREGMFIFPAEGRVKAMQRIAPSFEVMATDECQDPLSIQFPDLIWFSPGFCCFSTTAWSLIGSNLNVAGDITTLVYSRDGEVSEFVLVELSNIFDCIDFDRSTVHFFDTPPFRVKWVDDLVIKNTSQIDVDIFRIKHLPARVFCTEACVQLVKMRRLRGFTFHSVPVSD